MDSAETTPLKTDERLTFGPAQLAGVLIVAIGTAVAARFCDNAVPVIAAAVVAALVPKVHGWSVRGPIAVMAALLALFLVRMWPGAIAAAESPPPSEAKHLLTWVVALPIVGAIGILFVPRQAHAALRGATLSLMLITLAAALPLLRVSMGGRTTSTKTSSGSLVSASTITSRWTASRCGSSS